MVMITNNGSIFALGIFHEGRSKFVIIVRMVEIARHAHFQISGTHNTINQMARRYRRLVRIEAGKAIRCIHRISRAFFGHNIDGTASPIYRKTRRNIALVHFDICNLIDGNIVESEISLSFYRNAIDKHLDILAFHTANIDFAFAAHASGLTHLYARRCIHRLRNTLAGILQFRSIDSRNSFHFFCLFDLFRFCIRFYREFV